MSSRLISNWIISVAIAQIPEGMLTNLNDLYYEGTQGYYDVSFNLFFDYFLYHFKQNYVEAAPKIEKSLINWKMRQSIESACHMKCEDPNVEATRFPVESFDFSEDPEGRYLVHLLERTACLKNCYAGTN